jgi:fumarate hydratase subunit beta
VTSGRPIELIAPFGVAQADALRAGDAVLLSGVLYTARDAAHERLTRLIAARQPLPVELRDQIVYYCGPTPARPGRPIGAAAPAS